MDGRRDGSLLPSSSPRLPSLSPLTGCVTPSTAAALMELSLKQLSQAPRRSWPTSQSAPSLSKARDEMSSLRQLAGRQLEQLQRAPGTPYQRTPTPAEHAAAEQKLARQLAHLAQAVQGANTQQEGGTEQAAAAAAAAGGASRAGQPHSKAMTPAELVHLLRAMASASSTSRPPTTLSVQDVTLSPSPTHPKLPPSSPDPSGPPPPPHPAWSALPGRSSPGSPGSSRPRSLLGSRGGLLRGSAPVPLGLLAAAAVAGTPPRSSSGAGCGGGGGPGAAGGGGAGEVWVNPGAMPPVSAAQRTRLLLGANMGNSATAEATGTAAPALAAAAAAAKLMSQRGVAPGGLPAQEGVQDALAAMAHARLQAGGQAGGPGAGTAVCAGPPGAPPPACAAAPMLDKPALGAPGNPRWGPGQPLEHFVPTRGLMYSVFSELDHHNAGKLTFSQFEEACVAVGLQQQQTQTLYQQLDPHTRGYFTMKDWASKNHEKQVASFTRLYVQTTRGMHGRPADCSPEVKSAAMALQVALNRLQLRNNGHVIRPERVLQAFEFIDADGSGSLSLAEVQDAFHGMGIFLTREALDEIVTAFDHNRNGSVEYAEFLNTLFPVTGKSYRRD